MTERNRTHRPLPAAGLIVFGVLLLLSGREDEVGEEGFAEFFGGSMAGVGVVGFGLNTAACVVIVLSTLFGRPVGAED